MGAKDWMLLYVDGEVGPVLHAAPSLDRAAARALVARLHPAHRIVPVGDCTLLLHPLGILDRTSCVSLP